VRRDKPRAYFCQLSKPCNEETSFEAGPEWELDEHISVSRHDPCDITLSNKVVEGLSEIVDKSNDMPGTIHLPEGAMVAEEEDGSKSAGSEQPPNLNNRDAEGLRVQIRCARQQATATCQTRQRDTSIVCQESRAKIIGSRDNR
jgi:hypothetical protein